jgi:hypothetical protein
MGLPYDKPPFLVESITRIKKDKIYTTSGTQLYSRQETLNKKSCLCSFS